MSKILIIVFMAFMLVLMIGAFILLDKYSPYSNKDCERYVHYENGQAVYDYYKCIPVTPVMSN